MADRFSGGIVHAEASGESLRIIWQGMHPRLVELVAAWQKDIWLDGSFDDRPAWIMQMEMKMGSVGSETILYSGFACLKVTGTKDRAMRHESD